MFTRDKIDHLFTYHAPADSQIMRYKRVRDEARQLAHTLLEVVPPGKDRRKAVEALRTTVMFANAAIACEE